MSKFLVGTDTLANNRNRIDIMENSVSKHDPERKNLHLFYPLIAMNFLVPTVSVFQYRAIAPIVFSCLFLYLLMHCYYHRSFPSLRALTPWHLIVLGVWGVFRAYGAPDPLRSIGVSVNFLGFVMLTVLVVGCLPRQSGRSLSIFVKSLTCGLVIAGLLALVDNAGSNFLRAGVRGLKDWGPALGHGLKPAITVLVIMMPLVITCQNISPWWRVGVALTVLASVIFIPAQSAKLAAVAVMAILSLYKFPNAQKFFFVATLCIILSVQIAFPLLVEIFVFLEPNLEGIQRSAAHRFLIWVFVVENLWAKPLLGWGIEASRAIPGGTAVFDASHLSYFGLNSPEARVWFGSASAQRLPLHPHNGSLQIWLELGLVGALIMAGFLWRIWVLIAALQANRLAAAASFVAAFIVWNLSYGVWQAWWWGLLLWAWVVLSVLCKTE
jgi:O-antigen ligase